MSHSNADLDAMFGRLSLADTRYAPAAAASSASHRRRNDPMGKGKKTRKRAQDRNYVKRRHLSRKKLPKKYNKLTSPNDLANIFGSLAVSKPASSTKRSVRKMSVVVPSSHRMSLRSMKHPLQAPLSRAIEYKNRSSMARSAMSLANEAATHAQAAVSLAAQAQAQAHAAQGNSMM